MNLLINLKERLYSEDIGYRTPSEMIVKVTGYGIPGSSAHVDVKYDDGDSLVKATGKWPFNDGEIVLTTENKHRILIHAPCQNEIPNIGDEWELVDMHGESWPYEITRIQGLSDNKSSL